MSTPHDSIPGVEATGTEDSTEEIGEAAYAHGGLSPVDFTLYSGGVFTFCLIAARLFRNNTIGDVFFAFSVVTGILFFLGLSITVGIDVFTIGVIALAVLYGLIRYTFSKINPESA